MMEERQKRTGQLIGSLVLLLVVMVGLGYPKAQRLIEKQQQAVALEKIAVLKKQLQQGGEIGSSISALQLSDGFMSESCNREVIETLTVKVKQIKQEVEELAAEKAFSFTTTKLANKHLQTLASLKTKVLIQSAVNGLFDNQQEAAIKGTQVTFDHPLSLALTDGSSLAKIDELVAPLSKDGWKTAIQQAIETVRWQLEIGHLIDGQLQKLQIELSEGQTSMTRETHDMIQTMIANVKTPLYRENYQNRFQEVLKEMTVIPVQ